MIPSATTGLSQKFIVIRSSNGKAIMKNDIDGSASQKIPVDSAATLSASRVPRKARL